MAALKTSTQNYIHRVWQETWDQQILNKLHNIHPSTSHWAALPVRRHDVRLTRLRIGHTRFTHRHLLLGENAPECPSCKVPYSVYHILIDCPIFNHHRITFFHTSVLTLSDLGHTACYTKCSNFPKPKKCAPLTNRNGKNFTSNNVVEGISFADMVSGKPGNKDSQPSNNNKNNSERQSHPNVPPTDEN
ncbi:RNase H domain-containing protein [Trichonephila clavipes]|nr:RNase H domain-containing protein [Trichonephila clavipes]